MREMQVDQKITSSKKNAPQWCIPYIFMHLQQWVGMLVVHWTYDRKVGSSNPGRSSGRIFFSRVNFVCWLWFGVCSTCMLPQWHVKYPDHSAKSAGGRSHLTTHTPLTQWNRSRLTISLSRHKFGNLSRNELTCNLSGNTWPQSSQFADPQWIEPGLKSGISVHELISTKKKKFNNAIREWRGEHFSQILASKEKSTTTANNTDV